MAHKNGKSVQINSIYCLIHPLSLLHFQVNPVKFRHLCNVHGNGIFFSSMSSPLPWCKCRRLDSRMCLQCNQVVVSALTLLFVELVFINEKRILN